jgi:hypothetical protein
MGIVRLPHFFAERREASTCVEACPPGTPDHVALGIAGTGDSEVIFQYPARANDEVLQAVGFVPGQRRTPQLTRVRGESRETDLDQLERITSLIDAP